MISALLLMFDGIASDVFELSAGDLPLEASSAHRLQGNVTLVSLVFLRPSIRRHAGPFRYAELKMLPWASSGPFTEGNICGRS